MKNKRAQGEDLLWNYAVYLVLFGLVAGLFITAIYHQKNGAAIYEDFYAKEISKLINIAKPGDVITIDVKQASDVAFDNKVLSKSETFVIDNSKKQICVKLGLGKRTCYSYFNDVAVTRELKTGVLDSTLLILEIKEPLPEE